MVKLLFFQHFFLIIVRCFNNAQQELIIFKAKIIAQGSFDKNKVQL